MRNWSLCLFALAIGSGTLLAQHTYSPIAAQAGGRVFRENCVVCHGPDGDGIPGVDLGRGKFRRASSDNDLVEIIKTGIPGTRMPSFVYELSEFEVGSIVDYLHYMASTADNSSASGDAVQGKAIFERKNECLSCHRVRDRGSRVGPDLTDIGSIRRSVELQRSLLDPNAEILPQNRFVKLITKDGSNVTGRLLNHDAFTVQLIDTGERLLSIQRSELREFVFLDKSPMPSYEGKLSPQELRNLVRYLISLKEDENP